MADSITWIVQSQRARPAIEYTIRLLSSLIGRHAVISGNAADGDGKSIWYATTAPDRPCLWIVPELAFWESASRSVYLPPSEQDSWENVVFPVWDPPRGETASAGFSPIPVDPVAATFFLVSRIEELAPERLDSLGRFCAGDAWIVRSGLVDQPLVNQYARLLASSLGLPQPESPWPERRSMAIAMSHDIDRIRMHGSFREGLRRAIDRWKDPEERRLLGRRLLSAWRVLRGERDPYDTFDELVRLHRAHEFLATFFWIATRPHERDADYHALQLHVESTLHRLRDEGFEIGLHGSHDSPDDSDRLRTERESLEAVTRTGIRCTRQHLLRFRLGQTWEAQIAAGLGVDSTMGFAERMGFRAGIAGPYRPWSFERDAPLDIWEVPLIMMEVTARQYMMLSPEEAGRHSQRLLERVADCGGAGSILWHNSSLNNVDWAGWDVVYDGWLEDSKRLGAWGTSVGALADRWAAHVRRLGNDA